MADLLGLRIAGKIDDKAATSVSAASETVAGIAELATQAETNAGTDDARIVTPLKLANASFHGKYVKNLLYHSLTHDLWQEGTTFNDIADDTHVGDLWNVVHNGQAPDVSGQAGVSTDPFTRYFRCTFDSASSQCGIVQFLRAADTVPLRGQTVSISADLWGTNVSNMRMAIIEWGGTLDTLTSDVVGTWGAGNPTLATDWTYIGTPASIAITSTRTRYEVENITISIGTSNLAVFIWTPDAEASGDLFNVADVQLERGAGATEFVARQQSAEELLVKRMFWRLGGDYVYHFFDAGQAISTTSGQVCVHFLPEMWKIPTVTTPTASTLGILDNTGAVIALTAISTVHPTKSTFLTNGMTWTGGTIRGAGDNIILTSNNSLSGFFDLDARL